MYSIEQIAKIVSKTNKFWVVFTGDSITSCEWVHPNWRDIVNYVLHEETTKYLGGDWKTSEWGIKCFNFAYDGSTTKDILEKINDIVLVEPNLVISLMGGNDLLFDISIDTHILNIKKIISEITNKGSKLVWCTSTPSLPSYKKDKEYEPYARATMKIKVDDNCQLLDIYETYKKFPLTKFFTFLTEENPEAGLKKGEVDPTHPNQLGNAYIAKIILQEVFEVKFDPELYIADTAKGIKYPKY